MSDSKTQKDRLFAEQMLPGDFAFDDNVASVFEDMINRSVPGYKTILAMIGVMAQRYCQPGSVVYDLGCSLGGATFAVAHSVEHGDYSIQAIDNSTAMIERLENKLAAAKFSPTIHCQHADILEFPVNNASLVILNFTLQFIPLAQREALIERIYAGMNPGGILIVSEKILLPDARLNELMIDLYHGFKETMGYSKLEISQKRTALENVLLPETLATHQQRLRGVGFDSLDVWFQCFNFASLVACKPD